MLKRKKLAEKLLKEVEELSGLKVEEQRMEAQREVWLTNGILRLMCFSPDDAGDDAVAQEELRTIVTESASMIPSRRRRMLVNI